MILCGGAGVRMWPHTESTPKPMMHVGGRPILEHIVRMYVRHGFDRFILCLGHHGEVIRRHFEGLALDADIQMVDTGRETQTGGRIKRVEPLIEGTFHCTYGDGVSDIDLRRLVEFHNDHGRLATLTVVRPRTPFGIVRVDDEARVTGFEEKPLMRDWVNGGFFVFEPGIFQHLGPDDVLERRPFETLAAKDELRAFRHDGFWQCMDTHKDVVSLEELARTSRPPWEREAGAK